MKPLQETRIRKTTRKLCRKLRTSYLFRAKKPLQEARITNTTRNYRGIRITLQKYHDKSFRGGILIRISPTKHTLNSKFLLYLLDSPY